MEENEITQARKTGLPPGTLVHVGEKKVDFPRTSVILYNENEVREMDISSVDELCNLNSTGFLTWINIDGVHDAGLIQRIGEHYSLDNLSLEDIMNTHSRAKIEEFDQYLFMVIKDLYFEDDGVLISEQVSLVLKENMLITFQEIEGDVFDNVRNRIRQGNTKIRQRGIDYLAYALMDATIDNYFVVLEKYERSLEELEDELIERSHKSQVQQIQMVKKRFNLIKRSMLPVREVVYSLHKTENLLIRKKTHLFIRDLYDHSLQINDQLELIRESVSQLQSIYISGTNTTLNNIMKTLTIVSTIFMALSLIAGIYGMNFAIMPERDWEYGYFFALALMGLVAVILVIYFRRKKWI